MKGGFAELTDISHWEQCLMTEYLIAARAAIILWPLNW